MAIVKAFTPNGTVTLAAGASASANVQLPPAAAGDSVSIYNATNGVAFVAFGGDSTVTADATGAVIPPGGSRIFDIPNAAYAAAILSAGATTGTVYFTRGSGSFQ